MDKDKANKWIMLITLIPLIIIEILAIKTSSHYKYDFIFVVGLLVGVYLLRKKIDLQPAHYIMAGIFLLLHFFGFFGFYELFPLGIEYDYWVHGFFGFMSAFIILKAIHHRKKYRDCISIFVVVLVVMLGLSAFHELFEYGGALALGEGEGVLFIGAGDADEWDTQKDMLNNVIGGLLGIGIYMLFRKFRTGYFLDNNKRKKRKK
ncbi:DUF2238 domain-containing protein [Candidatus Woesearchaeota archaeon]|jgi:uncharacterized membrane protein YjdF|nr:DUF2238 domain-containing protein [Candidatus Woesearchaeota archaeon]MBT4368679.1 DUF2238 domain-containing protein [Candidatus Woesearchaeota archaeon]MBT4711968.1 DUF2238 domain-containing protein [Candidatus Woesearchaeota archaeon]MBT6638863.1 DUF2238 domain-containing protein [Candidatus Woesearchaeota archaeon]MBT7134507.1 DUF2238 domain-containing protein [Candidatus Woesearchaeota archaeon]